MGFRDAKAQVVVFIIQLGTVFLKLGQVCRQAFQGIIVGLVERIFGRFHIDLHLRYLVCQCCIGSL